MMNKKFFYAFCILIIVNPVLAGDESDVIAMEDRQGEIVIVKDAVPVSVIKEENKKENGNKDSNVSVENNEKKGEKFGSGIAANKEVDNEEEEGVDVIVMSKENADNKKDEKVVREKKKGASSDLLDEGQIEIVDESELNNEQKEDKNRVKINSFFSSFVNVNGKNVQQRLGLIEGARGDLYMVTLNVDEEGKEDVQKWLLDENGAPKEEINLNEEEKEELKKLLQKKSNTLVKTTNNDVWWNDFEERMAALNRELLEEFAVIEDLMDFAFSKRQRWYRGLNNQGGFLIPVRFPTICIEWF